MTKKGHKRMKTEILTPHQGTAFEKAKIVVRVALVTIGTLALFAYGSLLALIIVL
jgi:hypothetical protein